jgi:hypothetical protein
MRCSATRDAPIRTPWRGGNSRARPRPRSGRRSSASKAGGVRSVPTLESPCPGGRRPCPARVSVEQQRHHHRRLVRRTSMPVDPVGRIERRQIEVGHRVKNRPHRVPLRHPVPPRRRHQKPAHDHPPMNLAPMPGRLPESLGQHAFSRQPRAKGAGLAHRLARRSLLSWTRRSRPGRRPRAIALRGRSSAAFPRRCTGRAVFVPRL